jgi:hypothetical protein
MYAEKHSSQNNFEKEEESSGPTFYLFLGHYEATIPYWS